MIRAEMAAASLKWAGEVISESLQVAMVIKGWIQTFQYSDDRVSQDIVSDFQMMGQLHRGKARNNRLSLCGYTVSPLCLLSGSITLNLKWLCLTGLTLLHWLRQVIWQIYVWLYASYCVHVAI